MTTQNNAAQPVLTDEEILAATLYGQSEARIIRNGRAIEQAVLSKLRAPVAEPWPVEEQPDGTVTAVDPAEILLDHAMYIAHERELEVTGHTHDSEGAVRRFKAVVERALLRAPVADESLAVQALKAAQNNIAACRPPGSSDPKSPQYDHDAFMWDYYQRAIDSLALASAPVADAQTFEQWWPLESHRRKYPNNHPAYLAAREAWEASAEVLATQLAARSEFADCLPEDDGYCESCIGDKCVTGPKCVTLGLDSHRASAPVAEEPCKRCGGPGWYTSHTTGYPESIPCSACNPQGVSAERLEKDPFLAAQLWRKPVDFADAYEGAREDLAIWKRRTLEAERDLRAERETSSRLVAQLNAENGPTHMGEPAALAGTPVAGEAIAGYMVGTDYFRPDVLAAARIYAENRGLTVRPLVYGDAAPQASEAVREPSAGDVVAVLVYRSKGRLGAHGQTLGADGAGEFAVVYRGDEFAALVKANEEIRALEAAGHRLDFAAIIHGEGYSGPMLRQEYVNRAALSARKDGGQTK